MKKLTWDEIFILQAEVLSMKSKDESTKVGCVIVGQDNVVIASGFNGFPRGIDEDDESRWERPEKYHWVEHAERNAIFNAARYGIKLLGAKAYLNWEPRPCSDCTRALIQCGISEVIGPDRLFTGKGKNNHYSIDHSDVMLREAGIIQRVCSFPDYFFT